MFHVLENLIETHYFNKGIHNVVMRQTSLRTNVLLYMACWKFVLLSKYTYVKTSVTQVNNIKDTVSSILFYNLCDANYNNIYRI